MLRRSENFNTAVTELNSNDISIRLLKGEVYKRGKLLDLTASEYKLLCLFMENPDQILSPEQILGKLWDCSENLMEHSFFYDCYGTFTGCFFLYHINLYSGKAYTQYGNY